MYFIALHRYYQLLAGFARLNVEFRSFASIKLLMDKINSRKAIITYGAYGRNLVFLVPNKTTNMLEFLLPQNTLIRWLCLYCAHGLFCQ